MRAKLDLFSRRALLAAAVGFAGLAAVRSLLAQSKPAATTTTATAKPATQPSARDAERIARLQEHYAKIYGEPLASNERLPRQIAIISLSRIDAPQTTAKLMEVFSSKQRPDPVIAYLAWEALHARHASLTPDQRRRWAAGGLKAAVAGAFPEGTVTPLLRALAEHQPTAFEGDPTQLALRVLRENDLDDDESGKPALDALRDLVAAWHEPRMVRAIIGLLYKKSSADLAKRIDHVLRGLPHAPPQNGEDARKTWQGASEKFAKLKVATAEELRPYTGKATVFPEPAKITDPSDPRWRAELEISKLSVSDFDLVWAIDATGSMNEENQLVAKETGLVIRVCSLVSKRARCGAIYFRHETDKALMQPCCTRAAQNSAWYQVKGYPLTPKVDELSSKMAAERIPRPDPQNEGNVHPGGAVHAAIKAAMDQMAWSKDRGARKAIVLVGDSRPTPGSEAACARITADAKNRGFQVHALVKDGAVNSWPAAIKPGGGETFPFMTPDEADRPRRRRMMMNVDTDPRAVFGRVAATVIRESVAPPYRDRVDPLVKILLDYVEAMQRGERSTLIADGKTPPLPPT